MRISSRSGATAVCVFLGQSVVWACFSESSDTVDDDDAADTTSVTSPSTTDSATVSATGPMTSATTSASTTQTTSDTDPPPVDTSDTDPSDTDPSETDPSETDPSDTDPGECVLGDDAECGDQIVVPGELCFFEPAMVEGGLDKIGDSVVVDLDQDGDADLVFSDGNAGFVALSEGGTLLEATAAEDGPTWSVAAGQLAQGGPLGIVFGGVDPIVTIVTYDLAFELYDELVAPGEFATVRMADLDDEGLPDLIIGADDSETLYVYLNDGAGQFTTFDEFPIGEVTGVADMRPYYDPQGGGVALAVLTRDGRLIVSPASDGALGNFSAVDLEQTFAGVGTLAIADFEGNNRPDLVIGELGRAFVYRGNDGGGWALPAQVLGESNVGDVAAAVGDVDNDDLLDVLLADPVGEVIQIYVSSPDGTNFSEVQSIPTPTSPRGVGVIDLDGDCANDVFALGGAWLELHRADP